MTQPLHRDALKLIQVLPVGASQAAGASQVEELTAAVASSAIETDSSSSESKPVVHRNWGVISGCGIGAMVLLALLALLAACKLSERHQSSFQIRGKRFQQTPKLTIGNEGRLWKSGDFTVRGTKGSHTLRVDQHTLDGGTQKMRAGRHLKILEGDLDAIQAKFRLDDVVTPLGDGYYLHKMSSTRFRAVLS